MERFIAQEKIKNNLIIKKIEEINHFKIKRINLNEQVEVLFDNKIYICQIKEIIKNKIILNIIKSNPLKEPKIKINIFQAVPIQVSLLDEIINKTYQAGAYSLTPVISKRSFQDKKIINQKYERFQKIIENTFKQTRANYIFKINSLINLKDLFTYKENLLVLDNYLAKKYFKELNLKEKKEFNILIGPEGGFEKNELDYLKNLKCEFLKLKPHILKTENVGFLITSLILNTI